MQSLNEDFIRSGTKFKPLLNEMHDLGEVGSISQITLPENYKDYDFYIIEAENADIKSTAILTPKHAVDLKIGYNTDYWFSYITISNEDETNPRKLAFWYSYAGQSVNFTRIRQIYGVSIKGLSLNSPEEYYSTDEMKTNKVWVDAEGVKHPVYRKIIRGYFDSTGVLLNDVKTIFDFGGEVYLGGLLRPIPYSEIYMNNFFAASIQHYGNQIRLVAVGEGIDLQNVDCNLWVEYVKTNE